MSRSMQLNLPPTELKTLSTSFESGRKSLSDWRLLATRALGKCGLSQKRAASDLGITEGQLSRQLAGVEHLSFWRMGSLPPEFWRELVLLILEFHDIAVGSSPRDQDDAAIGRAVREVVARCR